MTKLFKFLIYLLLPYPKMLYNNTIDSWHLSKKELLKLKQVMFGEMNLSQTIPVKATSPKNACLSFISFSGWVWGKHQL